MAKSADAFRTISEVAEWLDTPAHVLRFWESKFSQVKPVKRAGGRRYYRPQDMMLLGGIKKLLHDDGMTIKSVQRLLRQEGVKHVSALSANPSISGGYALHEQQTSAEPETEISSVVSFKSAPAAVEPEPTEAPAPAPAPVEDPAKEGTQPVPSFLSGEKSMPVPENLAGDSEPEATSEISTSEVTTAPIETEETEETEDGAGSDDANPPETVISIDIMSTLSKMTVEDVQARATELGPILDKIRAELDRTA